MVETIKVSGTPINHIAYLTQNKGIISVNAYEQQNAAEIAKAIAAAGFNAYVYSKGVVNVSVPAISLEAKQKTFRHLDKLAEDAKIAVRSLRQKLRQSLTKEELKTEDKKIQTAVDAAIKEIDFLIESKKGTL